MKFLVLSTMALGLIAKCFAQTPEYVPLPKIFDWLANSLFPKNAFNAKCVRDSCPQLSKSGLCPYGTDGKVNCAAVTQIMSILTACVATKVPICNTTMDPDPLPAHTSGFNPTLPLGFVFSFGCSSKPNAITLTGLSKSVFSVTNKQCASQDSLLFTVTNPSLSFRGVETCFFNLSGPFGLPKTNFKPINLTYLVDLTLKITSRLNSNSTQTPVLPFKFIITGEKVFDNPIPSPFWYIEDVFLAYSKLPASATSYMRNLANSAVQAACLTS